MIIHTSKMMQYHTFICNMEAFVRQMLKLL